MSHCRYRHRHGQNQVNSQYMVTKQTCAPVASVFVVYCTLAVNWETTGW